MANYEIVLKFSYTVEGVANEEEAYKEAIELMKCDTHPEPYDWASYKLMGDDEEKDEDFEKKSRDCPPNVFLCPQCPYYNTELCVNNEV